MSVAEFFRKFSFLRKGNVMQNESWDVRMDGDMVIAGLSERTREAYLRAARQLAQFHQMADPGTLEEQHVKDYLLWLRTEKRAAPGTLRVRITASEQWSGDAAYWACSYVFRYNPNGWQPKILEAGLYQLDGTGEKIPCTEKGASPYDSQQVTHPVPIDANGLQIDPSTLPGAAVYTQWDVLPELPYAALGV